jgi:hypothetical protein
MLTHYSTIPFEVFTIDNFLNEEEINHYKHYINTNSHSVRTFTNSDFINGKVIEPTISTTIYNKILPYLPKIYTDSQTNKWFYKGVTNAVMFAKVEPGKHFGIHTDTGYEYNDFMNSYSKYTVLIYLNDDYDGGNTTFYTDTFQKTYDILPKKGRLLCFDIDLFHSGNRVKNGTKYWIGTELVCGKILL